MAVDPLNLRRCGTPLGLGQNVDGDELSVVVFPLEPDAEEYSGTSKPSGDMSGGGSRKEHCRVYRGALGGLSHLSLVIDRCGCPMELIHQHTLTTKSGRSSYPSSNPTRWKGIGQVGVMR